MNFSPADKEVWRGANYNAAVIPFIWSLNCFDRCSPPQQLCNPPVGALNNTRPPPHLIYFCCEIICDIWNLIRVWLTDDCCVTRGQHDTTRLELSTKFCESFHKCFANTIHPLDIIIVNKHPNLQIFETFCMVSVGFTYSNRISSLNWQDSNSDYSLLRENESDVSKLNVSVCTTVQCIMCDMY